MDGQEEKKQKIRHKEEEEKQMRRELLNPEIRILKSKISIERDLIGTVEFPSSFLLSVTIE